MFRRVFTLLTSVMLITCIMLSVSYADDTCSITVSPNVTEVEITKGGREQLELNGIFQDSRGHELTYTLDSADESLKARINDGVLFIDPLELGEYEVKITAKCDVSGETRELALPVNIVEAEDTENPAQYGYDETPADNVSVYFTISCDGIPLVGNDADNTILAHLKVDVPYFDLALYGLEEYYRYHTENGRGKYIDDEVVERPTAMHLMIYVTERYYMGIPEDQCCKGTSGILSYNSPVTMRNMYGDKAYTGTLKAYELTGAATSTYMKNLWGHDENLMYYRNHYFPLMSPGWGSTTDYQLLSEGNTFDLGMYTNWEFYHGGAFCSFDQDEYQTGTGETLLFSTMKTSTSSFGSGIRVPISGLVTEVYDEQWNKVGTSESETAGFGYVFNEPGKYYLLGKDENAGTNKANKSPATAIVNVKDSFEGYDFTKITDQDGKLIPRIEKLDDITDRDHYHISVPDGTTEVNIEWPELSDGDISLDYYDFTEGKIKETSDKADRNGNTVTLDPSEWNKETRAAVLTDSEGHVLGAFTFDYYEPETINFAPQLKDGVKAQVRKNLREKKDLTVKMTDLFMDSDGDDMTFTVTCDEDQPQEVTDSYTIRYDDPGQHEIVFTPTDSNGKVGQTHTIKLKVTQNVSPELKDKDSKEVTIRYDESAKLNLLNVFSDFDDDQLTYIIAKDGEEPYEIDPEEITEYGDYINAVYREFWQARNFTYAPTGIDDIGTCEFTIKAKDDLGAESPAYTYIVNVVDDEAPVPTQESYTSYCMLNHYWVWDYRSCFSDPEGDALKYTYRVNDGTELPCDRYRTGDLWNIERILIDKNEKYRVTFYAADKYAKKGSFTVDVYPTEETIHEIEIDENSFDANKDGATLYDVNNGFPATRILGFDVSKDVTLRRVRYSEENGHYNYYLDVDKCTDADDLKFDLTFRSEPTFEGMYVGPSFGRSYYSENHVTMDAESGTTECVLKWNNQRPECDYLQIIEHWRWYRVIVNVNDVSGQDPEKLILEKPDDGLYAGELTDRFTVKAEYPDGVLRYVNDPVIDPDKFEKSGTNTLKVQAKGLEDTVDVNVKNVPSYMGILNEKGLYGRIRLAKVTDENGEPIEDAILTLSDPVINSSFSYDTYDDFVDTERKRYDIEVRLPAGIDPESDINVEFEILRDKIFANNILRGENASYQSNGDKTTGILTIPLKEGKGTGRAEWIDRKDQYDSGSHSYVSFNVTVKTGACEIVGKVSSWDDKSNCEFLAYPESLSDEEIRNDAMGERAKRLPTSSSIEEAVKNGDRYERAFKVEGLDAGTYKLAVVKPGKYVVKVVKAEIDGTDDLGTVEMRLFGDVNNDGKVRPGDAAQIARYIVGNRDLTEEEFLASDVTLDGKVRPGDATQIARYIVGKNSVLDDIK